MTTTGAIKYDYEQKREENELKNIEEILRDDLGKVSGALEFRDLTWSNQKASVKIVKLQENEYKIEYKIENKDKQIIKDWTEIENGGEIGSLELGDTVYARLTNETTLGVKYSKDTASITVNDIGKPVVTVAQGTLTTNSIVVSVSSKDNEAGMPDIPEYKYYIKKTEDANYPNEASYIGTDTSLNFTGLLQNTSYDIKVTTTDIAGNEGIGEITNITTGTVPNAGGEGDQIGAITFSNLTWNNGKAGVTITKNITEDYTIKYIVKNKTGTIIVNETEISSGSRVENLNLGDTVTAWLTDGINKGNSASITVNDTTPPSAPTLSITSGTPGNNGTYKSTVTVTITPGTDGQSGVLKTTYVITGSQTIGETEGTSINITAEGTSYITAYTYDKANNKTASQELAVNIKYNNDPVVGNIAVARVTNSTSQLTITAIGTDEDGDDLKYILWRGTSASDITKTGLEVSGKPNNTVTFKDTGLTMAQTYYYKVSVEDGRGGNATSQNYVSERTYCKSEQCEGGGYVPSRCSNCNGNGTITCSGCGGTGKVTCTGCTNGTVRCSGCNGSGKVACGGCTNGKINCSGCGGTGKVTCNKSGCSYGKATCPKCSSGKVTCTACSNGYVEKDCTGSPSTMDLGFASYNKCPNGSSHYCVKRKFDCIVCRVEYIYWACRTCSWVSSDYPQKFVHKKIKIKCFKCNGTAKVNCTTCSGTGKVNCRNM